MPPDKIKLKLSLMCCLQVRILPLRLSIIPRRVAELADASARNGKSVATISTRLLL